MSFSVHASCVAPGVTSPESGSMRLLPRCRFPLRNGNRHLGHYDAFLNAERLIVTKEALLQTVSDAYRRMISGIRQQESAGHSSEIYGDPTPDPADTETTVVHLLK